MQYELRGEEGQCSMSTCYAKAEGKAKLFRQAGPVMCGLVHVLGPETMISSLNAALYRSCVLQLQ